MDSSRPTAVNLSWALKRMEGVKTYNPAFDVTDHELIAGIITEYGIARAPYTDSLAEIMKVKTEIMSR